MNFIHFSPCLFSWLGFKHQTAWAKSQVEGSEDRNIILNWWFAMHPEKKQQAFQGAKGEKGKGYLA